MTGTHDRKRRAACPERPCGIVSSPWKGGGNADRANTLDIYDLPEAKGEGKERMRAIRRPGISIRFLAGPGPLPASIAWEELAAILARAEACRQAAPEGIGR
ncbi:MAG: hypothetical protein D6812_05385 [Deltaproteobacteria bacterium]|nr:MAG: hypothetical protein D6812_05385 [Deltaproteobacteria bacterium]